MCKKLVRFERKVVPSRLWPRVPWRRSLLVSDMVKTRRDTVVTSRVASRISWATCDWTSTTFSTYSTSKRGTWHASSSQSYVWSRDMLLPSFIIFPCLSTLSTCSMKSQYTQWLLHDGFMMFTTSGACLHSGNCKWQCQRLYICNHLPCTIVEHVHHVHVIFHSTAFFMTSSATGCSSCWDMPVRDDTMLRSRVPTSAFASLVLAQMATWWLHDRYVTRQAFVNYKSLCNDMGGLEYMAVLSCTDFAIQTLKDPRLLTTSSKTSQLSGVSSRFTSTTCCWGISVTTSSWRTYGTCKSNIECKSNFTTFHVKETRRLCSAVFCAVSPHNFEVVIAKIHHVDRRI